MYQVLPEFLPMEAVLFEEGEGSLEDDLHDHSDGENDEEETPPIISAIMNRPRNTPTLSLIDKISETVAKSPALEKARLLPVVNAAPNTPNSHSDRIRQLNSKIAENHAETLYDRSSIAIKFTATLPFTLPGNLCQFYISVLPLL